MSRARYVMRDGQLVLKSEAAPLDVAPAVVRDDLGVELDHHAYSDGRRTSSKSEFRRWTRDAGCIEKGNDREAPSRPVEGPIAQDVAKAYQMVRDGYRPSIRRDGGGGDGWQ